MTNDAFSATLRNNTANGCSWCLAYRMFCCFWFPCVLDLWLWAVSGFSFAKVNFLKIARKSIKLVSVECSNVHALN